MPFVSLDFPPGVYRNGTRLQARGRWFDANLVRWFGGAMQPVGGWETIDFTGPDVTFSEQGSTGFGDFDEGALPDAFEEIQIRGSDQDSEHDWTVEADGTAESGQVLFMEDRNSVYDGVVVWVDASEFADGEALVLVRAPSKGAVGVGLRVPDGVSTITGVFATLDETGTKRLKVFTEVTNADALLGNGEGDGEILDSFNISFATGDRYFIRLNVNGTTVRAKAWERGTTEPSNWQVDTTTVTGPVAAGGPAIVSSNTIATSERKVEIVGYSDDPTVSADQPDSGGETTITPATGATVDGPPLGMFAWRDNDNVPWLALGTPTKAYIFSEGLLTDVTPAGFETGLTDASSQIAGYGSGAYGAGVYGEGIADSVGTILEAQSWQFDNFGEFLVACAHSDGKLYQYQPNVDSILTAIAGDGSMPEDNVGLVVTPERFLVALGAEGDPRAVQWADQESLTTWAPTTENQAGDFPLSGSGAILAGHRGRGETLIWTTQDLWTMQYIGGSLVYSFQQVGANCGMIGRRAFAVVGGSTALWMGANAFFVYDGGVRSITSDVSDYVFNDLNRTQRSKIFTMIWPEFDEVWWFYPSENSDDIDRYVAYNYQEDHWSLGLLNRTAGVPRGVFTFPIMADKEGVLYYHERGTTYLDTDQETALVPSAESGPWSIADGDHTMMVREIIPDEQTLGDVQAYLLTRLYPTAAETESGPFTLANPTSVRVSGRQVSLKVEQVSPEWRVGVPRLDVVRAGRR